MLDTFISVWKCVENFLEPFKAKIFIFFMKSHVNMMNFHLMSDPKNMHFFQILLVWRSETVRFFYQSEALIIGIYLKLMT